MSWYLTRNLLVSILMLVLAFIFRNYLKTFSAEFRLLLIYVPYALLATLVALSIYYNRARLFVLSVSVALLYYLIQTYLQASLSKPDILFIYSLICIQFPILLSHLLFIKERGLLNRFGFLYCLLLPFNFLVAWYLLSYESEGLMTFVQNWAMVKPLDGYVMSFFSTIIFLMVFLTGVYRIEKQTDEFAARLLPVLIFSFVTLAFLGLEGISVCMFLAIPICLLMGVMETSYDMAFRDDLTGLLGRRALNERMKGLSRRYVIAMMDVDHFKKFNDTHGHDIGDEVLKMVAKQISAVGGGGTAYRYGGEEFSVIFAGKDIDYCEEYLEEVRENIEQYRMTIRNSGQRPDKEESGRERRGRRSKARNETSVSVTISIGMAEPDEDNTSPEQVLKAADTALYKAKKKGRNCLAF